MSDTLPTIWEGSAHTFAKHRILETYLKAWMPIMSRQSYKLGISDAELLFVDGFAGPGRYTRGELGSPILAIESVLEHSHDFPIPISFLFIEKEPKRHATLLNVVKQYMETKGKSRRIKDITIKQGDCETILTKVLDNYEQTIRKIGPAFFFLDQFGFSNVPMKLIKRIMSQPLCEVFSYLNWDHMNRFLDDETKWASLDKTFGGPEWRLALELEPNKRSVFMLKTYRTALEEKSDSKYIWHFAMCDTGDKLLYWLFFCTKNLKGLEEMKRAMCRADPGRRFRFSDKDDPTQLNLFDSYQDEMLAQDLAAILQGKILTVSKVKEFVLAETPSYIYKAALKILEERELLEVRNAPPKRRKGTFPDEYTDQMQLVFRTDTNTTN